MKKILFTISLLLIAILYTGTVRAYGECSQYGLMVIYNSYSNTCECMSGYTFATKYGTTQCVSLSSICTDKYGYQSRYNSLTNSCECSYGYTLGKDSIGRTQCISLSSICTDQLGYHASYNSYTDKCECGYGYVISGGTCKNGNSVCQTQHGSNSEYNNQTNKCECDSGYTFNESNQCVKKQNNVYFYLKEVNTDDKQAIIKSDYNNNYYLITYGNGCYSFSINRYLNKKIVLNLGTDFDVDRWDTMVLQDDDEVCDIRSVEKVDSDYTLETEDAPVYYLNIPKVQQPNIETTENTTQNNKIYPNNNITTNETTNTTKIKEVECDNNFTLSLNKEYCIEIPTNAHAVISKTDVWLCDDGYKEVKNSCVKVDIDNNVNTTTLSSTTHQQNEDINVKSTNSLLYKIINFFKKLKFW